ncbi:MAG: PQQ-like beta-propeller repeat protein, partial [Actinomycetota bacterium]|nr:PQQ-like beta-propeller repeat protein [Actinomycetota bacterium]
FGGEAVPAPALPLPLTPATSAADSSTGGGSAGVSVGGGGRPRLGVVTKVVDVTGDVVRRDRTTVPFPSGDTVSFLEFGVVGDLDGDRRRDSLADVVVVDVDRERFLKKRRFVAGRTGRRLWSPDGDVQPLRAPVDGDGDDVVRLRSTARGLRVAALRGDDGSRLWRRRLRTSGFGGSFGPGGFAQAADLTGDGRAEVIVVSDDGRIRVLGARHGATRWSVGRSQPAMPGPQPAESEPE